MEKNFSVSPNSTQHAPTNMANTLKELCQKIRMLCCHCTVLSSHVEAKVRDILNDGLMEHYQRNPENEPEDGEGDLGSLEIEDFEAL